MPHLFTHAGHEFLIPTSADMDRVIGQAIAEHGPWGPDSKVTEVTPPARPTSDFGQGQQVMDDAARQRIDGQQAELTKAGFDVGRAHQFYDTGTRLAASGYAVQADAKRQHEARMSLTDGVAFLMDTVQAEQRHEVIMTAAEASRQVTINGRLRVAGFALGEGALRGLLGRIGSPSTSYLFGMRDRIMTEKEGQEAGSPPSPSMLADKARMAEVLTYELARYGDTPIRFRVRDALQDCYAVTSPKYAEADAPLVLPQVVSALPQNARVTVAYDWTSTDWELRAYVHTPTPAEQQAVGEAFEGYASLRSNDAGAGSLRGGGGITLVRCLNASTYAALCDGLVRMHRGAILLNLGDLAESATKAVRTLAEAWGTAREAIVPMELTDMTMDQFIPGLWRGLLTDRRSELVGVLPGRREAHVQGLTMAYDAERRNPSQVVRADFAQGWTRYIQDQPTPVRRQAEAAIASWVVNQKPMRVELA